MAQQLQTADLDYCEQLRRELNEAHERGLEFTGEAPASWDDATVAAAARFGLISE